MYCKLYQKIISLQTFLHYTLFYLLSNLVTLNNQNHEQNFYAFTLKDLVTE